MRLAVIATFALLAGCSNTPAGTSAPVPGASAAIPKGTLAVGAPITASNVVTLSTIAGNPGAYANQTVTTSGKVSAVCQERGCWMEIQDTGSQAHIRMHGHSFFVPRTASGHMARVQATVLTGNVGHCEDAPPPSPPGDGLAKVELDATGVELD